MNIRRSGTPVSDISSTSPLPSALDAPLTVNKMTVGIVIAWLAMSTMFLLPIVRDPALAIRGDNYWEFSQWFGSGTPYPHTNFGPLFPLLIRVLRELGVSIAGVVGIQKLLVLLNGYLVYRIGRSGGLRPGMATLAGGVYTVYPIVQAQSTLMFAETIYLTLLLASIAVLMPALAARHDVRIRSLIFGFVLLGLAALARGNGLVLFAGLGVVALFRCPWRKVLIAGIIGALPVLLWSGLNYHWYGHFKPTSSGDANIAASIVGPVYSELEGKPRVSGPDIWIQGKWQDHYPNQFDYAKAVRSMAIDYALEHPGAVLIGNIKGWFKSLLGPAHQDYLEFFGPTGKALSAVSFVVRAILLLGIVLFIATDAWRRSPLFTLVLALVLLGHIVSAGAAGFARFGFPVDAFTTVALALALTSLAARWDGRVSLAAAP